MIKKVTKTAGASLALLIALAGCTVSGTTEQSEVEGTTPPANEIDISAQVDAALEELTSSVLSLGPNGEAPAGFESTELTADEVAQIQAAGLTAAIVMHYAGNDWSSAQIEGLKDEFARLGIEVVAVTDADFKPEKQVSDIETVMALNPDIIISIPTDPVATSAAYKKAAAAGIKLVFMDNVPADMVGGTDYVSVVSADNMGNGAASAHLMAKALNGQGKIGLIYHDADFFVTAQRYQGFKDVLSQYPGIEVVEEKGIGGPDFAGDAQAAATALLTKYPDIDGLWGVWDVPAEGMMAAAREAGRLDLKIATQDLGTNVAIQLAKNELIIGLGAQRPYDQGVAEARLAAAASIGKTGLPVFVALGALPVSHENVLEAWKTVYSVDAPSSVSSVYVK
ncbi:MAG: sugar ABC transporter substrate-binding protein [Microbacteriaceae bacterium BACL28 MAG-120531-bin53]|jgi:ribose transport system substrate-binding protein|uniref:substrate-binding domain-containing protein n=1 Tax=Aquiluna sp. TaxID=2053504 RepID=UPI0007162C9C|nr:MAG: sugar ABC transporter substrate-binding protein [Microbacteriaceae bacterium BACL28 MAG-120531-bin53]